MFLLPDKLSVRGGARNVPFARAMVQGLIFDAQLGAASNREEAGQTASRNCKFAGGRPAVESVSMVFSLPRLSSAALAS